MSLYNDKLKEIRKENLNNPVTCITNNLTECQVCYSMHDWQERCNICECLEEIREMEIRGNLHEDED